MTFDQKLIGRQLSWSQAKRAEVIIGCTLVYALDHIAKKKKKYKQTHNNLKQINENNNLEHCFVCCLVSSIVLDLPFCLSLH